MKEIKNNNNNNWIDKKDFQKAGQSTRKPNKRNMRIM